MHAPPFRLRQHLGMHAPPFRLRQHLGMHAPPFRLRQHLRMHAPPFRLRQHLGPQDVTETCPDITALHSWRHRDSLQLWAIVSADVTDAADGLSRSCHTSLWSATKLSQQPPVCHGTILYFRHTSPTWYGPRYSLPVRYVTSGYVTLRTCGSLSQPTVTVHRHSRLSRSTIVGHLTKSRHRRM